MRVQASLSDCGTMFRIDSRFWSTQEPLSRLDDWIAFYKEMMQRKPLPRGSTNFRKIYGPKYAALKVLKAQLSTTE